MSIEKSFRPIFLDEPTTGLDPQARRGLWPIVRELKHQDKFALALRRASTF